MIFKVEKNNKRDIYRETCFPGWQEIKRFTEEVVFFKWFFDENNVAKLVVDNQAAAIRGCSSK